MDAYQERYTAHQARKRQVLIEIMRERHSNRMYLDKPIPADVLDDLAEIVKLAPSSCDRHGVQISRVVTDRDSLALLGGLLVGGVGWIHRAPAVLLLHGDPKAYKAPGESTYMPYLDAGVIVQHLLLAATAHGLASAYINPNIRSFNQHYFDHVFGSGIYCGAVALGYPLPPEWVGDTS